MLRVVIMVCMVNRVLKFFTGSLSLAVVRRASSCLLYIMALQVGMVTSVEAVSYTITDLGPVSAATDINNKNQFVGSMQSHPTIWLQDGTTLDLGTLDGDTSLAIAVRAVNDNGWVVGQAANSSVSRPFLWQNGSMEDLGSLEGDVNASGNAWDVNIHRQVAGSSTTLSGIRAFLWQNGTMKSLGTLGGDVSEAFGMNDSGQVVGRSTGTNNLTRAFLWENGTMQDLGALVRPYSEAKDINNNGQIVGETRDDNGQQHAFIWQDGIMQDLNMPTWYLDTWATAINDVGQVVGSAIDIYNQTHALLWENGEVKDLCDLTICKAAGWDRLRLALSINNNGSIVGYGYINGLVHGFLISVSDGLVNKIPEANAGLDQTVITSTVVQLDGSGSADPDVNYPLTYAWEITQKPVGSNAALSDYSIVNPIFITDEIGDYIAELVVTDSLGLSSVADAVVISTINSAPVANAGVDQLVVEHGSAVQLDGGASTDVDNDALTYAWSFIERPAGSTVVLNDATVVNPVFVVDTYGYYTLQLVVTDSYGAPSVADEVVVSFKNLLPVANAGSDQEVVVGDEVQLTGSGSDVNLDSITYQWNIVSMPEGSQAILPVVAIQNSEFVPDVAGSYVFSLVVNDGLVDGVPDNVMITVTGIQDVAFAKVSELYDLVSAIDPGNFRKNKKQSRLLKKISKILDLIGSEKYRPALKKLQHEILRKTDGCFAKGFPEKNDWVSDCEAQAQLYPVIKEAMDLLQRLPNSTHGMWNAHREDRKEQWKHINKKWGHNKHMDRKDRRPRL